MNCICRQCNARRGNRSQRFYFNHNERIRHTIVLNDDDGHETVSFVIHGDPLPRIREANDLVWSEEETEGLRTFLEGLRNRSQNEVIFEEGEELQIEVCFLVREVDTLVPHELLLGLSETLTNMMVDILFPRWIDVREIYMLNHVTVHGDGGMIVVSIKNALD